MTNQSPIEAQHVTEPVISGSDRTRGALSSAAELARLSSFVIFNVIAFLLIIRYLPKAEMGWYALVNVVANLALILADLQMEKLAVRRIAQREEVGEVIGAAFGVRMVGSVLATIAMQLIFLGIGLLRGHVRSDIQLAALLASSQFFGEGVFVVGAVFQAQLRAYLDAAPRILFVILRFGLTIALIKVGAPWWELFFAWVSAYAIAGAVGLGLFRVKTGVVLRPRIRGTGPLVREAFTLGVAGLLGMATVQFGTIYLGVTAAPQTVAIYNAAILPIQYLSLFAGVIAIVAFPLVSRAWGDGDTQRFGQIDAVARTAILTLFLPVVVVLFVVPLHRVLETAFGKGYGEAATALRLMSVALVLASLVVWAGFVFLAISKPKYIILVNSVVLAVAVAAAPIIVPRYGLAGIGWIGIAGTVAGVVATSVLLRRDTPYVLDVRGTVRALLAGALLFFALLGIRRVTSQPLLLGLAVACIYPILVFGLKVFPATTLATFRKDARSGESPDESTNVPGGSAEPATINTAAASATSTGSTAVHAQPSAVATAPSIELNLQTTTDVEIS